MITCMSAVVRVMFPALPEDTSSSLAPFFLYLDNLWGMGVADEVLFPTETVLFVGQIIGVISTDNPDIGAAAAAAAHQSEEQGRGCDEQEITVHFERHGPRRPSGEARLCARYSPAPSHRQGEI